MKVTVQLVIESENDNTSQISNVGEWQRSEPLQPSNLGLTLTESKELLKNIQLTLVEEQINQYQQTQFRCKKCDHKLLRKGLHSLTYRTLFGTLKLNSPRLFHCDCQEREQKSTELSLRSSR